MYKAGQWVTVPVILGHRQVNYTECPGNVLFGMLPAIRAVVKGLGDPKIFAPAASPAAFSRRRRRARHRHPDGRPVGIRRLDHRRGRCGGCRGSSLRGDGDDRKGGLGQSDDAGKRLADGTYTVSFGATSANGTARPASVPLRIDTVAPVISGLTLSAAVISPNGDGLADSLRLTLDVSEAGSLGLSVLDAKGRTARTVAGVATASGTRRLAWNGKVSSAGGLVAAPDGRYSVVVRATDLAGNEATVRRVVTVDDTLGHPAVTSAWLSPNGDGVHDAAVSRFAPRGWRRPAWSLRRQAATSCAGSRSAVWRPVAIRGRGTARTPAAPRSPTAPTSARSER